MGGIVTRWLKRCQALCAECDCCSKRRENWMKTMKSHRYFIGKKFERKTNEIRLWITVKVVLLIHNMFLSRHKLLNEDSRSYNKRNDWYCLIKKKKNGLFSDKERVVTYNSMIISTVDLIKKKNWKLFSSQESKKYFLFERMSKQISFLTSLFPAV